jgi:L-fucose mutarotase
MLKGLNPLLSPELLHALRAMGHGDEITIVDANYPATSSGPEAIRLDGISATAVLDAVLSVMPLDDFVPDACWGMTPVEKGAKEPPIFGEFRDVITKREGDKFKLATLERFKFYEQARDSFAIVATGERRLYGNIILKKGIIRPD